MGKTLNQKFRIKGTRSPIYPVRAPGPNPLSSSILITPSPMQPLFLRSLPWSCQSNATADSADPQPDTQSKPADLTQNPLYTLAENLMEHPLCLGLVSLPVLVGIAGGRQVIQGLDELGTWSEELFRGDRLPLLHTPPDQDSPDS